jgi:DNA-binding phage protein
MTGKRKIDLVIEKRKAGQNVKDIARELGLDTTYVYRVLKKSNIPCNKVSLKRNYVISPLHQLLGKFLKRERLLNFEEKPNLFAKSVNMSTQRLRSLESGTYDPTLTDLVKIMSSMNISFSVIDDLIKSLDE